MAKPIESPLTKLAATLYQDSGWPRFISPILGDLGCRYGSEAFHLADFHGKGADKLRHFRFQPLPKELPVVK